MQSNLDIEHATPPSNARPVMMVENNNEEYQESE